MEGPNKLYLPLGDRPLLRWSVDAALAAGLAPVAVVVGHGDREAERALADVPVELLENREPARGLSSSVDAAIAWAAERADAVVLLLGDEPEVAPDVIRRVVARWIERTPAFARARYDDRPGHPVIARLPLASGALPGGDQGLRTGLEGAVEIRIPGPAPLDVDTEAEYRALLARLPQ